jgi:hypothetical protein
MGCGCKDEKKSSKGVKIVEHKLKELHELKQDEKKVEKKKPSVAEMTWSFTSAMKDFAKSGFETVNKEDYDKRVEICNICPWRDNMTCTKCGCFINLKAKIKESKCPDDRWKKLN